MLLTNPAHEEMTVTVWNVSTETERALRRENEGLHKLLDATRKQLLDTEYRLSITRDEGVLQCERIRELKALLAKALGPDPYTP